MAAHSRNLSTGRAYQYVPQTSKFPAFHSFIRPKMIGTKTIEKDGQKVVVHVYEPFEECCERLRKAGKLK